MTEITFRNLSTFVLSRYAAENVYLILNYSVFDAEFPCSQDKIVENSKNLLSLFTLIFYTHIIP